MVHQQFMLVPNCTVAQNVALGETGRGPFMHLRRAEDEVRELGRQYGIDVDPRAKVGNLSPTVRQQVEILAALWRGRTVLILDEPTSVLGPQDTRQLFATMRRVAGEGCAVVFTSHKLAEVIEVCDAISVMRHGTLQTTVARDEVDGNSLAALMVGHALAASPDAAPLTGNPDDAPGHDHERRDVKARRTVLRMVAAHDGGGAEGLAELAAASGEIVGVAGVAGNGQLALAEALAGLAETDRYRIEFEGVDITDLGPMERAALGIAYVPEDSVTSALVPAFPVAWNLALRDYRVANFRKRRWFLDFEALGARAVHAIAEFDIRGAVAQSRTATLSGGNQQKVVLARELDSDPALLVIANPTVGLDVGAAQSVHRALRAHRMRGSAIVLISTDLDEIEALSDRIAVLYRGSIVDVVPRAEVERRTLGLMMTGLAGSRADPRVGA
jgi:simple sugar transport system ATP-binding protein